MAKKRTGLSKRTRFEVFKRDLFTCQYCGRTPPTVVLQVDHILAVSDGGTNDRINLVTACQDCNGGKSNVPLAQVPTSLALEMAKRRESSEQVKAYNEFLAQLRNDEVAAVNRLGHHWCNQLGYPTDSYTFSDQRAGSIRIFLRRMPEELMYDLIDVSLSRIRASKTNDEQAFRYVCGCCWKAIRQADGTDA